MRKYRLTLLFKEINNRLILLNQELTYLCENVKDENRKISFHNIRKRAESIYEEVKRLSKGTYSFDRFCYHTPYSCMVNGKRIWYHSLNEMYYRLTGDDKYYKEEYNMWIEHEWWFGLSRPTPYKKWLEDRGITL